MSRGNVFTELYFRNCYGLFPYFRIRIATTIKNSYLETLTRALSTNRTRISKEGRFFCPLYGSYICLSQDGSYIGPLDGSYAGLLYCSYLSRLPDSFLCSSTVYGSYVRYPYGSYFFPLMVPMMVSFLVFVMVPGMFPFFLYGLNVGSCRFSPIFYVVPLVLQMDFCRVI
jgi:hypothetical protein